MFFGFLTLFGWFIDQNQIKDFVDIHGLQWYSIISTFAIFLGIITLIKLQLIKVLKNKKVGNTQSSLFWVFYFHLQLGLFTKEIRM